MDVRYRKRVFFHFSLKESKIQILIQVCLFISLSGFSLNKVLPKNRFPYYALENQILSFSMHEVDFSNAFKFSSPNFVPKSYFVSKSLDCHNSFSLQLNELCYSDSVHQNPPTKTTDIIRSVQPQKAAKTSLSACPLIANDITLCPNTTGLLKASGASYYRWRPSYGLSDTTSASIMVNLSNTQKYKVIGYTELTNNLIINGSFDSPTKMFKSDYKQETTSLYSQSVFAIGTNPFLYHTAFSVLADNTYKDISNPNANMMIVNGSDVSGTTVWEQEITVEPGKFYIFSAYVAQISSGSPPVLQFSINGKVLGTPYTANSTNWSKFYSLWESGTSTKATISILNQNTQPDGNDFALDDIKFVELCMDQKDVTVWIAQPTSTTNLSICPSEFPYKWNGVVCTQPGTYFASVLNKGSCITNATLNLTSKSISSSHKDTTICSADLPYIWNGQICDKSATYSSKFQNSIGCDSIATLTLSIEQSPVVIQNIALCSNDLPYSWRGLVCDTAGTYATRIKNLSNGCDTVTILHLLVNQSFNLVQDISVCSADLPYLWRGESFDTTGKYVRHAINTIGGCDTIATLNLTVSQSPVINTDLAIYSSQLPYFWNKLRCDSAGLYYARLKNGLNNCDTIASLSLKIKTASSSQIDTTICSANLPFIWNGHICDTAGVYLAKLINTVGCDSTVSLRLTVSTSPILKQTKALCSCDLPYIWHGLTCDSTGTYITRIASVSGLCDTILSLELSVNQSYVERIDTVICSGNTPFIWHGMSCNSTGVYTTRLKNVITSCDTVATLNLTVNASSRSVLNKSLCSTDLPFNWNGLNCDTTGLYSFTLTSSLGCDSIALLNLFVDRSHDTIISVSCCDKFRDPNGNPITRSGYYRYNLLTAGGCDSIVTYDLIVNTSSVVRLDTTICSDQLPFVWGKLRCDTAGVYTMRLTNSIGCDSIMIFHLNVNKFYENKMTVNSCGPYFGADGKDYSESGDYKIILKTITGCDSILDLHLLVHKPSVSLFQKNLLPSELPFVWNNQTYYDTGDYTSSTVFKNAVGCDSVAKLKLRVSLDQNILTNASVCDTDLPYMWNGQKYTTTGIYTKTFLNAADKLISSQLNLTVNSPNIKKHNITLSYGEKYRINNNVYTEDGIYTDVLPSSSGCDSTVITTLHFIKVTNTFSPDGDGINDVFMSGYKVKIFNRNGIQLFDGNNGWDGTSNGSKLQKDTYFFILYYNSGGETKVLDGSIMLVR